MDNEDKKERVKKPWPTKAAMEQVYEMKLWGAGNEFVFYSGEGSHQPEIVTPYIQTVTSFLKSFSQPLRVCDLGCGDFNIGKQLLPFTKKYSAVDIVCDLINYNKAKFQDAKLIFQCLDIAVDSLPIADCAIVRQVLQHLSNAEVQSILYKLKQFKYIVLTEHIPLGEFIPNKDIISGQGNRLKHKSGLDVFTEPFNIKVKSKTVLCDICLGEKQGRIVTWLIESI